MYSDMEGQVPILRVRSFSADFVAMEAHGLEAQKHGGVRVGVGPSDPRTSYSLS